MPLPQSVDDLGLVSKAVGALPLINDIFRRLRLNQLLGEFVPVVDRRQRLAPAVGLAVLLRNLLIEREPLYGVSEWAAGFECGLLGLSPDGVRSLNDDRVGRCLDALFDCDRAALMTAIVVQAVRAFDLDTEEVHNDSTTVTMTGSYKAANGSTRSGSPVHRITHGYNKDHRPDLKQLLYILTTTADGNVPIWSSVDHGNTTDDKTHIETWNTLRRLLGTADFLYVADSKLCTKENMEHIAREVGHFLTIMPKTRSEDTWFRDWIQTNEVAWTELQRKKNSRRRDAPDDVFRGFESPLRSVEGYRIIWLWSSQKESADRDYRLERIQAAIRGLELLASRLASPRSRFRARERVDHACNEILLSTGARQWIKVDIEVTREHSFTPETQGRPGPRSLFTRDTRDRVRISWRTDPVSLDRDAKTDGLFPLILNDEDTSMHAALVAYKHQPALEKRHEQLKTVFAVMPVSLKSPHRIEAILFLFFIVLLVQALLEREVRRKMADEKIKSLPVYPEDRSCEHPTTEQVFRVFEGLRRHTLTGPDGAVLRRFHDEFSPLQLTLLRLLGLSPTDYRSAADSQPPPCE